MGSTSALELLEAARKLIAATIEDADSVKVLLGRWRIIKFRLEKLGTQLQDMSSCPSSFLQSYSLCGEVLEALLVTLQDSRKLAEKCRQMSYSEGKLQMQSNLDSLAARFNQHINDCDVVIKNSVLKESMALLTKKRSNLGLNLGSNLSETAAASREMLRWAVRDLITRLQIGIDMKSKQRALISMVELMDKDDKNVLVVAGQGGIPVLVHMLDAGMPSTVREKAASAVCSLARAGCCEQELISEGVLAPLVRLLESGTGLAKERAVSALHALTYTPENARCVAAHGGLPALVQLCRTGTPVAQASAAGSIRNLASVSELASAIAEEGESEECSGAVVTALLGLIRSGTDAARESATDALHCISSTSWGAGLRGVNDRVGAVEALLRFLESVPPPKPRQLAIDILKNISGSGGAAGAAAYRALVKVVSEGLGRDYEGNGNGIDNAGADIDQSKMKKMVARKRLTMGNMMMAFVNRKQLPWASNRLDSKIKSFFFRKS